MPIQAHTFDERERVPCYKCGISFPSGEYTRHVRQSTHSAHQGEKAMSSRGPIDSGLCVCNHSSQIHTVGGGTCWDQQCGCTEYRSK